MTSKSDTPFPPFPPIPEPPAPGPPASLAYLPPPPPPAYVTDAPVIETAKPTPPLGNVGVV